MAWNNSTILADNMLLQVNGQYIGCATSNSIETTAAEIDVTCKDSGGFTSSEIGLKSWSSSAGGFVNMSVSGVAGYKQLYDLWHSDTKVTLISTITDGVNTFTLTGTALITGLTKEGSAGDKVSYSISFKGDGDLVATDSFPSYAVTITAAGATYVHCVETGAIMAVVADDAVFYLPDGTYSFVAYDGTTIPLVGSTSVVVSGAVASGTITIA